MAIRYLAVIRPPASGHLEQREATIPLPGFATVVATDRLTLHVNENRHIVMPGHIGAIIGDLFTHDSPPRVVETFNDETAVRARKTRGSAIVERYWGGYIAFVADAETVHILRDPSATLPCLYVSQNDATIVASDVNLLIDSGYLSPKIDFPFLAAHLYAPDVRSPRTGLIGLHELLAGFRLTVENAGHVITPCWSPWDYCSPAPDRSAADLAAGLKQVIFDTVGAWALAYPRSLLGVSGGLDSSILAASLTHAGADLTCVTLATDEAEGDERAFARILRDGLKLRLVEAMHRPEVIDFTVPLSGYLPRPVGHAFGASNYGIRFELERELGIDAFFSGIGGDNVFCYTQSATPLVDRFRAQGISLGLFETLSDICRLNNASVGAVLKMAAKKQFSRNATYQFTGDNSFLGPLSATIDPLALSHPWLATPEGALPGKSTHVSMLARLQGTIDGLPRDHAPQILPLISQPIMEACLRIPMWDWIAGGRNRAVARMAFTGVLPQALIDRTSKGGPNSFAYTAMEMHKAIVRELVLQGRLVEEGVLDPHQIETALDARKLINPAEHIRLSDLAQAEAWVRHWERQRK